MSVLRVGVSGYGVALGVCLIAGTAAGQVVYRTGFEADEERAYIAAQAGSRFGRCVENQPAGVGPTWNTSMPNLTQGGYGISKEDGRPGQCLKVVEQSRYARFFAPEHFWRDEDSPQHVSVQMDVRCPMKVKDRNSYVGFVNTAAGGRNPHWVLQFLWPVSGERILVLASGKQLEWDPKQWYRVTVELDQEHQSMRTVLTDAKTGALLADDKAPFPANGVDTLHVGTRGTDGSRGDIWVDNLVMAWGGRDVLMAQEAKSTEEGE